MDKTVLITGAPSGIGQATAGIFQQRGWRVAAAMQMESEGSSPEITAEAIYRAATDGSWWLRYTAGGNAGLLLGLRKVLPDPIFFTMIRRLMA
ncbi:hypothetical protein XM38_008640 [Halomicronema hongdechloris C2206]|uniref:Uncharacterized protein n=1 Tax=Halomicronema hongdechloris C2206 TaxID=1641165 RepID=A0A1Z3HHZ8_9CYAN|nr:hypothetical protein [Halomicronema hongdechloris]ASC69934.1 hypothetical protein XM38_008640 [Halomicronema hongdechloris C2206]